MLQRLEPFCAILYNCKPTTLHAYHSKIRWKIWAYNIIQAHTHLQCLCQLQILPTSRKLEDRKKLFSYTKYVLLSSDNHRFCKAYSPRVTVSKQYFEQCIWIKIVAWVEQIFLRLTMCVSYLAADLHLYFVPRCLPDPFQKLALSDEAQQNKIDYKVI